MLRFTRRNLLKAGLAASAGAVGADKNLSSLASPAASARANSASAGPPAPLLRDPARDPSDALAPRQRLLLDFGWRFHLGHANDPSKDFDFGLEKEKWTFADSGSFLPVAGLKFDDSGWKPVDLPHDWAVELPFENTFRPDHGAKPLGRAYPETSIGWYRRVFDIPASDAGSRIAVEFDGAFRRAMVIFNGHYLGENFSGYAPFRFDLTDFANYGEKNVLTVRLDATLSEGWFYEGAGIYRHVWLTTTHLLHLAHWGTFVRS